MMWLVVSPIILFAVLGIAIGIIKTEEEIDG